MEATAMIYDLKDVKGKNKIYLMRTVFGYKDKSNHGRYSYEREGSLTPFIQEKWGRSVIIIKRKNKAKVEKIFENNKIPYKTKNIKLI